MFYPAFYPARIVTAALLCFLITSCSSNFVKSLSGMNALRQHLTQKYGDQVNLNLLNSRYLNVAFINSQLNHQDRAKRIERAQDAASFVARNYDDITSIEQIWISFVATETRYLIINYTRGIDSFGFDRNGARLTAPPVGKDAVITTDITESSDPRAPVARYSQAANRTGISVTRIQLEGDIKRGVALVPHYTVPGDARILGAATTPPEFVVFDFASYADKPLFQQSPPLEIYCDGRLALKGVASLVPTAESGFDETVGQFLSVQVSFKLLQRMAHSKRVQIILGQKKFELLPDDINALARMTAYVPRSSAAP